MEVVACYCIYDPIRERYYTSDYNGDQEIGWVISLVDADFYSDKRDALRYAKAYGGIVQSAVITTQKES